MTPGPEIPSLITLWGKFVSLSQFRQFPLNKIQTQTVLAATQPLQLLAAWFPHLFKAHLDSIFSCTKEEKYIKKQKKIKKTRLFSIMKRFAVVVLYIYLVNGTTDNINRCQKLLAVMIAFCAGFNIISLLKATRTVCTFFVCNNTNSIIYYGW